MGAVASVFEAIARRCPENTPDPWTKDINEQRRLVVATRRTVIIMLPPCSSSLVSSSHSYDETITNRHPRL